MQYATIVAQYGAVLLDVGRYRLDPQVAYSALPNKILDAKSKLATAIDNVLGARQNAFALAA